LCIISGFPLAACDAQAGSLSLKESAKGIRKRLREATCDAQAAKEYIKIRQSNSQVAKGKPLVMHKQLKNIHM
jgi:hypothetical protein